MSLCSVGYSCYEIVKVCDTPVVNKVLGWIIKPVKNVIQKIGLKGLWFVKEKAEVVAERYVNVALMPWYRLFVNGWFSRISKGLGGAEGIHIIADLGHGVVIKAPDGGFHLLSYETLEKLQKSTESLPQEVLDMEVINILDFAGTKVPTGVQDLFDKFLTENVSPEKIHSVMEKNGIEFFIKEVPVEQMDYKVPGGSWEKAESYIQFLKGQIPAQYMEFSMVKFMMATVVTVALGFLIYEVSKGTFVNVNEGVKYAWGSITWVSSNVWNGCVHFWKWMGGKDKAKVEQIEDDVSEEVVIKTYDAAINKNINVKPTVQYNKTTGMWENIEPVKNDKTPIIIPDKNGGKPGIFEDESSDLQEQIFRNTIKKKWCRRSR